MWLPGLVFGLGCDGSLVTSAEDLGPYVVLSGRLDTTLLEDPDVDPADFSGGLAWLVIADGQLGLQWQPAVIEPRLFGYAMPVSGPPDLDQVVQVGSAPSALGLGDGRLAVGLPVLHTGTPPALDGPAFLLWALGTLPDVGQIFGPESTVRAVAAGHLVVVLRAGDGDLVEQSGFVDEPPWCRWAGFEPGLALYRDDGPGCDGWRFVTYAEEYQGVDMLALTPGAPDPSR